MSTTLDHNAAKVVLVTLSGQGDIERFLISEQAYTWMCEEHSGEFVIPPEVLLSLEPFKTPFEDDWSNNSTEELDADSGSCENDIALTFSTLVKHYDRHTEVMAALAANSWELVDEYDGCIY